jgi:hypothetical protein
MSSIMIMPDQIYNDFNLLDEGEEGDAVVGGGTGKSPNTVKNTSKQAQMVNNNGVIKSKTTIQGAQAKKQ